jgi:DNA modification methylase
MKIHPAAEIFPMLSDEELDSLAVDIKTHGLRHPLVMHDRELLDGRNRLAACKIAGVDPSFVEYEGDSPVSFVISVNIKRRQLDASQRACVAVEIMPMLAVEAEKRLHLAKGRGVKGEANLPHVKRAPQARDQAADVVSISPRMVQYAKEIKAKNPEAFERVKSGEVTVNEVQQEIKREKRESIKIEQNKQVEIRATVTLGQCTAWLDTQQPCDLLLTDPPYSTDIEDIEAFACTWLPAALAKVKSTGRAYVFIGPYPNELLAYLTVAKSITNMTLENILVWTYRNTLGPTPKHKYKNNWQACLYFIGKNAPPLDCPEMIEQFSVQDISAPDGRQGDRYHEWQKPMEIAERFVRHSTKPGELVLDPFAGTGTHLLAAAKLGRVAHGCDIDQSMIDIAIKRGCKNACVAKRQQRVGV